MDAKWLCLPYLCAVSDVGARSNNEDGFIVEKLPSGYYLGIADGLGGHAAGEVASEIALTAAKRVVVDEYEDGIDGQLLRLLLRKAHELANSAVLEEAVGERKGMGTTLLSAVIRGREVFLANTGDSRAQLIRDGDVVASTRDHNLLRELLDKGIALTKAEAMEASRRLTHVIGGRGKRFAVDLYRWEARPGDWLLLSTDGLHDYLDAEAILDVLSRNEEPGKAVMELLREALGVTRDNVTIILYRWW
ncbi:PP2C family serine/threonine-protein phosphatase [Thermococcus sp. AM4]|uniref:PP2C family protein-serine/threonine phosphatase n=1 Tax=Thermococcus sp. (strain AM4) TaxID=246969 RepID=UPI000187106C|nr:protein phosphatase 2C domain-containing protein [Thermococcus sp. AM4]EEB73269.1 serine/threonine protein phosphatase [Thermococcus sp. AM4]